MKLTGPTQAFAVDTDAIDTVAKHRLGTKAYGITADEVFIYLKGVASTVQYSAVTYDEEYATTLAIADAVGPVAVAMAAIVADSYGWYQIYGKGYVRSADDVADNAPLFLTGEAGELDDAAVSGDLVFGMWSRAAITGEGELKVQMSYPFVEDGAYVEVQ